MQYQLIAAQTAEELERRVNNEIRSGWEVTGGLVVFIQKAQEMLGEPRTFLAQAMIRSQPQPE